MAAFAATDWIIESYQLRVNDAAASDWTFILINFNLAIMKQLLQNFTGF